MRYLSFSKRMIYSVWGVLPVPPTDKFPMQITGIEYCSECKIPQSKSRFRNHHPNSNIKGKGSQVGIKFYFVIFLHVTSYLLTNIVNLSVAVCFLFVYFKKKIQFESL